MITLANTRYINFITPRSDDQLDEFLKKRNKELKYLINLNQQHEILSIIGTNSDIENWHLLLLITRQEPNVQDVFIPLVTKNMNMQACDSEGSTIEFSILFNLLLNYEITTKVTDLQKCMHSVSLLLSNGLSANPKLNRDSNASILSVACKNSENWKKPLELLFKHGANPNISTSVFNYDTGKYEKANIIMQFPINEKFPERLLFFLKNGLNPNYVSLNGESIIESILKRRFSLLPEQDENDIETKFANEIKKDRRLLPEKLEKEILSKSIYYLLEFGCKNYENVLVNNYDVFTIALGEVAKNTCIQKLESLPKGVQTYNTMLSNINQSKMVKTR